MVGLRMLMVVALPVSGALEWSDRAWGMTTQAGADLPPVQVLAAAGARAPVRPPAAIRFAPDGSMELSRLSGAIELDGVLDEAAWRDVPALPMTRFRPDNGAVPSESTVVRVAYDDGYVWVAGAMYDSDPAGIRVNSLTRDNFGGSDELRILFDTFRDRESGLIFGTSPAGLRWDAALSGDGEHRGSDPLNMNWNGFWDVRTRRTAEGWFAEMRIPLSTLRFQAGPDGRVTMGVVAARYIARKNELVTFPHLPDGVQGFFMKPSLAQPVVLEGVRSSRAFQLTPYVLGGTQRSHSLEEGASTWTATDVGTREIGLDLKYGLTNNLTLDLTLNTDFAQAEADAQQVNLTRFSLFLPEKRQFFQERAGVFDFGTGGVTRLFHSRRIGLSEDGAPLPILAGGRIVGRVGAWDVGILDMQTGSAAGVPGQNFGVLRVRRSVVNDNSYAGAMLTSRAGDDGTALAFGVDGSVRVSSNGYVSAALAASDNPADATSLGERSVARIAFDRRTSQGLGLSTQVVHRGAGYDPSLGFSQRNGTLQLNAWAGYGVLPTGSTLRRIAPNAWVNAFLRNDDGSIETLGFGHWWNAELRNGGFAWLEGYMQVEDLRESFQLRDAVIPAGSYRAPVLAGGITTPWSRSLRAWGNLSFGSFYDGRMISAAAGPSWVASPRLELAAEYHLTRIEFDMRGQRFDSDVVRLRLTGALDTALSAAALVQYNRAGGVAAANLRLRWNLGEGRDLFAVYNHTLDTARDQVPLEPLTRERQLLLKLTWAVQP